MTINKPIKELKKNRSLVKALYAEGNLHRTLFIETSLINTTKI